MKIHYVGLAAFAGALISYGCSSSTTNPETQGDSGGGSTSGAGSGGAKTNTTATNGTGGPSSTNGAGGSIGPSCTATNGTVIGMTSIYYGDTDFNDKSDATAWKQFGFNLDGKISTAQSADLCKPVQGGSKSSVYPDGVGGIDNSFGSNILPLLLGLNADFTTTANAAITSGEFTIMIDLDALGAGADQASVVGKIYTGTTLTLPPAFNGKDCWPVAPEGLTNPMDIASSNAVFMKGTLAGNHWDSAGAVDTLPVKISVNGVLIELDVHHAHISMDLDVTHKGAGNGQIGGVLDTTEFVAEAKKLAGDYNASFCSGPLLDQIVMQIQQASDILADGTQDPGKDCDGISIGLGFKGALVQFGGIGLATPASPDPCAP